MEFEWSRGDPADKAGVASVCAVSKQGPQRWHITRDNGTSASVGFSTSDPDELREYARELEARIARDLQRVADLHAVAAHCEEQAAVAHVAAQERQRLGREQAAATRAKKKDPFGFGLARK